MEVEKDTDRATNEVLDAINICPIPLLAIKNHIILQAIEDYFPYSHGMEFECFQKKYYDIKAFKTIKDIMDVNVDSSEQRYRLPKGLNGLICLWEVCQNLNKYSALDLRSSNHYHTDMTDVYPILPFQFKEDNNDYVINELKTWGTATNLDNAHLNSWYKYNTLGTLEVRIGEPTFDYRIIVKRLIQCGKIVTYLRDLVGKTPEEQKILKLQKELQIMNDNELFDKLKDEQIPKEEINKVTKTRIIKI